MVKRVHHRSVARHLLAGTLGTVGALAVSTQIASANSVLVKAGDTVWKIAQENKTTVKAVEDANGGAIKKASNSVDLIYAGQRLQLPGNDSTASTMADADASGYYTVAPGDTLSKIAEHFNISVSTLKALNGLTSDQLYIGQRLLVDGSQATAVLTTPSAQQATTTTPTSTVSQPVETAPVTSTTQTAVSSAPVNSATPSSDPSTQMSTAAAVNTTATVNAPSANNVTTSSVSTVASQASSSAVATSTQPSQTSAAASTAQPQSAAYQSQTAQVSAVASTANVTTNYQGTSAATANGAVAASSSQQQTAAANSQTQSNQASGQAQTSTTSQAQSQAPATTNASQTQSTTNSNLQSGSVVSLATKIANSNSVPYVWGGSSLSGMDCSGLVDYVYKNAEGKQLPHNTVALESCVNQHSVSQAQAGDILFWGQHGATYHSAIYIGNNQYVAAAKPGTNVSTYTISSYFMPSFAGTVK